MYKLLSILILTVIVISCSSDPVGITDDCVTEPLLAPPLGDVQLEGLCDCNLDKEKRIYSYTIIQNGCTHGQEVDREDHINPYLDSCFAAINDEVNSELESICAEIEVLCELGYYYDELLDDAWRQYEERVRYLSSLVTTFNRWIISALVVKEKNKLIANSEFFDNKIAEIALQLKAMHLRYDDIYNGHLDRAEDCIRGAQALCLDFGITCLEFTIKPEIISN